MSAKTNNTEKLAELLKDYSVEELRSIFIETISALPYTHVRATLGGALSLRQQ